MITYYLLNNTKFSSTIFSIWKRIIVQSNFRFILFYKVKTKLYKTVKNLYKNVPCNVNVTF